MLPADALLGGEVGKGFYQMMDGVEVGRVNVAARACGLANRAFELGVDYAQQRVTFGKPIAEHQAVAFRLAEMATKVEAAHLMMVKAARMKDSGRRNDLEAGMAKYLASEYCKEVVEDSFRIHGGYGYSKEYEIERLYREAPMLMIGEETADIQRMIIARRLLEDYKLRGWSPTLTQTPSCWGYLPESSRSNPNTKGFAFREVLGGQACSLRDRQNSVSIGNMQILDELSVDGGNPLP